MRPTSRILIPMEVDGNAAIVAAAEHPIFGSVRNPDHFTAYVNLRVARSLPKVVGPESVSGKVFGMHPAVVARSFETIVHKQMNLGHKLVALGAKEDRICGCVLQAAYPEMPEGGWVIPKSVDEAPSVSVLAALFKQARGVDKMLGDHLSGKNTMALSIEFTYYHDEVGIFDPSTGLCFDRATIPSNLKGFLGEDNQGRLFINRNVRKPQLVLALGGVSKRIWFSGIGYTDRPAEDTAVIDSIAAESREGMTICAAADDSTLWAPGMPVTWSGGIGWGRGTILAVREQGLCALARQSLTATVEDPVLYLKLPDGARVMRRASTVRRKF